MVKLQYAVPAKEDLKSIYNFIAFDSAYYAKKFIQQLKDRIKILKSYPEQGRIIHPLRYQNLRQLLFKEYRIIYIYDSSTISILTIHHQSRLLENIDVVKEFEI